MPSVDFLAAEMTRRYGTVQRARRCFLYTRRGVRLTDLYQEGGRAILGWGGGDAFTRFKNVMNRGLTGSFDTDYGAMTARAVAGLLSSEREVFVYTSRQTALRAALSFSPSDTSFYMPWSPAGTDWSAVSSVIVAPPLPWAQSLYLVAVRPETAETARLKGIAAAVSERIPAALHAAVARSVYDLIAAVQERKEKDWFIYDTVLTRYWNRKGPYLFPRMDESVYGDFLLHCLDCALVISPDFNTPSIVPFGADRGVFSRLKNAPFSR